MRLRRGLIGSWRWKKIENERDDMNAEPYKRVTVVRLIVVEGKAAMRRVDSRQECYMGYEIGAEVCCSRCMMGQWNRGRVVQLSVVFNLGNPPSPPLDLP